MRKQFEIPLLLAFVLSLLGTAAEAQVKVQVLRKNYEKIVDANGIKSLSITAEKADIEIVGWNEDRISYEVIVATKHPEKQQVLDDYKKMKFLEETLNRTLYLRSYLLIDQNDEKPQANFEVTYKVKVPKNMSVTLKNSFGTVTVTGLENNFNGTFKFCNVSIENNRASADLNTSYGDLTIRNLTNNLTLNAKHTTLFCERLSGNVKITTTYGKLNLKPDDDFTFINLQSDKTDILVDSGNSPRYGIALTAQNMRLQLPVFLKKKSEGKSTEYFEYNAAKSPKLSINATFGSLTFK